jgi:DNA modification methylase
VEKLMQKKEASILFTDPPYLVDYTGKDRPDDRGKDWTSEYQEIPASQYNEFYKQFLTIAMAHIEKNSAIYIWHASARFKYLYECFVEMNILPHQTVIWVKPRTIMGYSIYHWQFEPCLLGRQKGFKPHMNSIDMFSNVWQVDYEGKKNLRGNEHPTQKPTRLFEIPILKHTKRNAICYEPFAGSGSQFIACEKAGRICYGMEISPAFCDVIRQRYANFIEKQGG